MLIGAFAYPSSVTASSSRARAGDVAPAPNEEGVAVEPAADQARQKGRLEQAQLRLEQMEIADLAARDREVRVHEQAHAAVGGEIGRAHV